MSDAPDGSLSDEQDDFHTRLRDVVLDAITNPIRHPDLESTVIPVSVTGCVEDAVEEFAQLVLDNNPNLKVGVGSSFNRARDAVANGLFSYPEINARIVDAYAASSFPEIMLWVSPQDADIPYVCARNVPVRFVHFKVSFDAWNTFVFGLYTPPGQNTDG